MPRRHRPWSPEDDALLRDLWADRTKTGPDLARRLGRSVAACWSRRAILGLPARAEAPAIQAARLRAARAQREAALTQARRAALPLAPADAAWLAGIVDASGSLSVPPSGTGPRYLLYGPGPLIAEVYRVAGARGSARRTTMRRRASLGGWVWELDGALAVGQFLRAIRPHLRVRASLADAILAWPQADGHPDWQTERERLRERIAWILATPDIPHPPDNP